MPFDKAAETTSTKRRKFFPQCLIWKNKQFSENNNSFSEYSSGQGDCSFTTLPEIFAKKAKKRCAQCPKVMKKTFLRKLGVVKCFAGYVDCSFDHPV